MNKKNLLIAAFVEGFLLVSIELIYAQLLHPFYGESYFVWLSMLSITMLASAAGYFFGSYIQFKGSKWIENYIVLILLFLSAFFVVAYQLSEWTFALLIDFSFLQALFLHTILVIFIPVLFVTSVSPIIVKYYAKNNVNSGKAAGRVFFISTIGGIISIYSIAFIFLPYFDFLDIIKGLTILIILVNLYFLVQAKYFKILLAETVLFILLFIGILNQYELKVDGVNTKILHREYGIMGELEIRDEGNKRYMSLNRTTQSAIKVKTSESLWTYPYRISTYSSIQPEGANVLVAGLGGGVLVNQLVDLKFNLDVIEFDKRSYDLAKEYMSMTEEFDFVVDDFRHYINKTDELYDIIILDLSKGENIPTNVYSLEAFERMSELLKPNGFIILHFFGNIFNTGDLALHSIMKTLEKSGLFFAQVKKAKGDRSPEQLLIASNYPEIIPSENFRISKEKRHNFILSQFLQKDIDYSDGQLITDAKSTLDIIQFSVVESIRKVVRSSEFNKFYKKKE
jgi:spermidine synthase